MNFFRRLFLALVPPPRRPVTWSAAWPLVLFLVAFAVVCLVLEYGHVLMFSRPYALAVIVFAP